MNWVLSLILPSKLTSSSSVYILSYSQSLWNFPNFCLWGGINYMKKCLSKSSGNGIGAFSTIGSESSRVFLKVLLLINTFSFILEWVSTLFLTWILLEYFPWMFLHLKCWVKYPIMNIWRFTLTFECMENFLPPVNAANKLSWKIFLLRKQLIQFLV